MLPPASLQLQHAHHAMRASPATWLQGHPAVEAVVRGVMANNDPPIPAEHVMGLGNSSAVDAWLLQHPETVGAGRRCRAAPVCCVLALAWLQRLQGRQRVVPL